MHRFPILLAILFAIVTALAGCGGGSEAPPVAKKVVRGAAPKPSDQSRRFPKQGRLSIQIVDNHLLGKEFLPGGNLAEYEREGKKYKQFLIVTRNPETAALLVFEFKGHLDRAKYIGHFGGYFGMDGEEPVFIFPKGKYAAGFVGLSEKDADAAGRDFAARLN